MSPVIRRTAGSSRSTLKNSRKKDWWIETRPAADISVRNVWTWPRASTAAVVLLDRSLLYRGRFPRRIYPPSGRHVVLGTLEAHQGLAWLGLTLAGLAAMLLGSAPVDSLNMLAGDTRWQLAAALLAFFLLLITTAVVHESAHYLMARRLGCPVDGIYVRAGAAGVLYRPRPGGSSGRAVVLAGPLVGAAFLASALVVLVGLPATWWLGLGLDQMQLSLAVAVTVLLVHQLVALTPLAKDGRELIRLTRLARVSLSATEHQPRRTSGPGEGQGEHAPRP